MKLPASKAKSSPQTPFLWVCYSNRLRRWPACGRPLSASPVARRLWLRIGGQKRRGAQNVSPPGSGAQSVNAAICMANTSERPVVVMADDLGASRLVDGEPSSWADSRGKRQMADLVRMHQQDQRPVRRLPQVLSRQPHAVARLVFLGLLGKIRLEERPGPGSILTAWLRFDFEGNGTTCAHHSRHHHKNTGAQQGDKDQVASIFFKMILTTTMPIMTMTMPITTMPMTITKTNSGCQAGWALHHAQRSFPARDSGVQLGPDHPGPLLCAGSRSQASLE